MSRSNKSKVSSETVPETREEITKVIGHLMNQTVREGGFDIRWAEKYVEAMRLNDEIVQGKIEVNAKVVRLLVDLVGEHLIFVQTASGVEERNKKISECVLLQRLLQAYIAGRFKDPDALSS
jgi:hypothetical protein